MVYAVPQLAEPYVQSVPAPPPVVVEQPPTTGRLILEVQPAAAQVFVDGYYVGTPDDFTASRGGLLLETGAHRIDLVLLDHEQIGFDVKIAPNQLITYRQVLKPMKLEPVPAPPARSAPATFYLIPGCYMGNIPPKEANLRPTCDPARAITFQQ